MLGEVRGSPQHQSGQRREAPPYRDPPGPTQRVLPPYRDPPPPPNSDLNKAKPKRNLLKVRNTTGFLSLCIGYSKIIL